MDTSALFYFLTPLSVHTGDTKARFAAMGAGGFARLTCVRYRGRGRRLGCEVGAWVGGWYPSK